MSWVSVVEREALRSEIEDVRSCLEGGSSGSRSVDREVMSSWKWRERAAAMGSMFVCEA